jgi:hypothetical protein
MRADTGSPVDDPGAAEAMGEVPTPEDGSAVPLAAGDGD